METVLEKPTKKDSELAKHSLGLFEKALQYGSQDDLTEIVFRGTDDVVKVPKKAMYLFAGIISRMAEGHTVKLVDTDEQLSTQEAADYLHVSRPYLIKLVEKGEIPFTLVGTHRRIALRDVELYAQRLIENREKQLEFLAKQAQELHLGYN